MKTRIEIPPGTSQDDAAKMVAEWVVEIVLVNAREIGEHHGPEAEIAALKWAQECAHNGTFFRDPPSGPPDPQPRPVRGKQYTRQVRL